ncbi:GNAT family N-acetyltransferase [Paenibacillus rhizovicinus]|uniref:GNAT family N-acetyltransferase n=1 Tax=Paenibacillus rhizovicinus TaxID=2704463 RepID=A0A6C0NW52_9BACL|nr:GNAT family N-acetyltransferase [Paenibacillus rhizovicinus]QHW29953.1 GNAT family N-acetyltransferase [Paenibacillus rhizovicinus]
MGALTYRMAGLDDAARLAQMNRQLIEDEGSENPMNLAELEVRMRNFLETGWSCAIFELDREIAGYALFEARPRPYDAARQEVFLRQYFIAAEHRGRGIGRAGIELLETSAFPPDSPVVIDVLSGNSRGERFWRGVGFEPYAVTMKRDQPKSGG